jgi:nicotinamide-nucleotide amidase
MQASIVSVGTELLFGQTINTNSAFLSERLNRMGIDVMYHFTVGDNPSRLEEILKEALLKTDLVITTGGLGPTQDDLTKEIVCQVMQDELVLNEPALLAIQQFFLKVNRPMTDNNLKQAYVPKSALVLQNEMGTAPGFALTRENKTIACLPGPPREMAAMFDSSLAPYIEKMTGSSIYYRMIRTYGIGESALETALMDLIDTQTDPTIATYAMEGECYLRVTSKRSSRQEAINSVDEMVKRIITRIGSYVYSLDGQNLVDVVASKLVEDGLTLSCAESCTGGLFAATLTRVPGISAVFDRGYVTYSNQAKMDELGVNAQTLEKYGAVSKETAIEMAMGVFRGTKSNICVSVTGIAGPDGGTLEKPVGLVHIALVYTDKEGRQRVTEVEKYIQRNHRDKNREITVLAMLHLIYQQLLEK